MTPAERMREKAAQLREQAAAAEGRARRVEQTDETRRKVLLGSWLASAYGRDLARMPEEARARFDQYLTRNRDRALFGFPALGASTPEKQTLDAPAASASGSSASSAGQVSTDLSGDTPE